jgi:hypothetical protein
MTSSTTSSNIPTSPLIYLHDAAIPMLIRQYRDIFTNDMGSINGGLELVVWLQLQLHSLERERHDNQVKRQSLYDDNLKCFGQCTLPSTLSSTTTLQSSPACTASILPIPSSSLSSSLTRSTSFAGEKKIKITSLDTQISQVNQEINKWQLKASVLKYVMTTVSQLVGDLLKLSEEPPSIMLAQKATVRLVTLRGLCSGLVHLNSANKISKQIPKVSQTEWNCFQLLYLELSAYRDIHIGPFCTIVNEQFVMREPKPLTHANPNAYIQTRKEKQPIMRVATECVLRLDDTIDGEGQNTDVIPIIQYQLTKDVSIDDMLHIHAWAFNTLLCFIRDCQSPEGHGVRRTQFPIKDHEFTYVEPFITFISKKEMVALGVKFRSSISTFYHYMRPLPMANISTRGGGRYMVKIVETEHITIESKESVTELPLLANVDPDDYVCYKLIVEQQIVPSTPQVITSSTPVAPIGSLTSEEKKAQSTTYPSQFIAYTFAHRELVTPNIIDGSDTTFIKLKLKDIEMKILVDLGGCRYIADCSGKGARGLFSEFEDTLKPFQFKSMKRDVSHRLSPDQMLALL